MRNNASGKFFRLFLIFTVIALGASCNAVAAEQTQKGSASAPTRAIAVLHPTQGSQAHGTVTFTRTEKGVQIKADVKGLSPGKHGFHVHEYGDCSAPDFTSAGGHFNPENMPHAGPSSKQRHVGDLGNLEADQSGAAKLEMVDPMLSLAGEHSIVGHAVIVHAEPDDLTSQPTGGAGGRVACGVIGVAKD